MPGVVTERFLQIAVLSALRLLHEGVSWPPPKYILFPEGGYRFNNKNKVCDFKAGSFKIALKSHAPIVPIALIDSYKVFNSFHIGPITTYVHYLKPICYEEYKGMKTQEIADLVKIRIEEKIQQEMQAHR